MKQPWTETKEALFTTYQTDAHGLSAAMTAATFA